MARRARNIYKRKDGRREGRYIKERVNGEAKYAAVYAKTYTEVKDKLEKAKDEQKKKQIPVCKAGSVTDMGQKWLAEVSVNLKESSIVKYEDLLRCYIYPSLGTTDLSDITNEQMMNFATDLKKNGGKSAQGLSGSTVSEVVSVIAGLRGYALRHGYSVVFTTDCVSIRQQRNDIRVFSIEEEERLVSWLLSHKDSDAVPDDMIASRFNSIVEDVASITNETGETKKNLMDLLLYYFSKEIRMPIDKLTSDEKDMLMSIFERSGRYKAELRNMTKGRRKKR